MTRTFDWTQNADLRSFDHLYGQAETNTVSRAWPAQKPLDQGQDGSCTGHGLATALASLLDYHGQHRNAARFDRHESALALYELATSRDEFKGDWPTADTGSSVNGVMKAARDLGFVSAWQWCQSEAEVRHAVLNQSPVVLGVPFYASMETPDAAGLMTVDPNSQLLGGHCVNLPAFTGKLYRLQNSWGESWGLDGSAWLTPAGLQTLLDQGGEAAAFTLL